MKKLFTIAALAVSVFATKATAGLYEQLLDKKSPVPLSEYLFDMRYMVAQGTMTLTGNATFYGHATALSLKTNGGQANWTLWSSSRTEGNLMQGVLFAGESFAQDFSKPVSSPTIVTISIPTGTTVQWFIGGLKK